MISDKQHRVLVVAPIGRDAPLICGLLGKNGIVCEPFGDVPQVCEELRDGAGAILLTEEALRQNALESLSDALGAQPGWSDVPVILLTSNSQRLDVAARQMFRKKQRARGALVIVEKPVRPVSLLSAVDAALMKRTRQYEVRDYLDERNRADAALRRSEAYLAESERLSHTGSWAWDASTGQLFWSLEHFRICGVDPETFNLSFEAAQELIHPEDRATAKQSFYGAIRERSYFEGNLRFVRPDGAIRFVHSLAHPVFNASGDLTEYVGTVIDNTERKYAEDKLRESERRFREFIESIPHHVWSFRPDGTLGYWNQQVVDYTGLTAEELHQGGWGALHPADVERAKAAWQEARSRGAPFEQEQRIRARDGSYRRFVCRAVPVPNERGGDREWFGTASDVEERRCAEEALQRAQAKLAHMARVTTMGELAASIAHEVNQPLSAVVTDGGACLEWLSGTQPNLVEARAAATRIIEEAIRASDVIARIRSLVKKGPPQMAPVDMNELITEVFTLIRHELVRHDISLRTTLAVDLFPARGDTIQLRQVLLNIIVNAIESISMSSNDVREVLVTSENHGTDQIFIEVRDSGVGIDPETVERLFMPFVTNKPEGLGMGLAISRSIIESSGGRIWAAPNEGRGAAFFFSLPAASRA